MATEKTQVLQRPVDPRRDDVGVAAEAVMQVSPVSVLVVEDDEATREAIDDALAPSFGVRTAASGLDALTTLSEHDDVGVVLVDQRMPGMSGVDLLLEVRRRFPRVVRVLYTALREEGLEERVVGEGVAHDYLQKPVDPVALGVTMQSAMERYLHRWSCDGCAHSCEECPFEASEEVEEALRMLRTAREELRISG